MGTEAFVTETLRAFERELFDMSTKVKDSQSENER